MYAQQIKPVLDWLLACIGLILLAPLLFLITLFISLTSLQNPIFQQRRIGYQGRLFWLYKFRTMTNARDASGNLRPDASRMTICGRWLRRTSADELPQLINVLLGQMSLVGPRPLLARDAPLIADHIRHTVRPGLTGWAQVHGRNDLNWAAKLVLDTWYVRHVSFRTDCWIFWKTLFVLVDNSPPATPLSSCYSTEPEATPESSLVS